jgi:hypothetical protein
MRIEVLPTGSRITLPSGEVVLGAPHDTDAYRATARQLGYGDDTLAMCRDHDPLHALLAGWLGLEVSYGMLDGAGRLDPADAEKAAAEEAAVLAVQRFMRLAGGTLPQVRG